MQEIFQKYIQLLWILQGCVRKHFNWSNLAQNLKLRVKFHKTLLKELKSHNPKRIRKWAKLLCSALEPLGKIQKTLTTSVTFQDALRMLQSRYLDIWRDRKPDLPYKIVLENSSQLQLMTSKTQSSFRHPNCHKGKAFQKLHPSCGYFQLSYLTVNNFQRPPVLLVRSATNMLFST